WAIVTVLLAIGVAGTLVVPLYARTGPRLGAFPFFYWYQLAWIPLVAILSTVAYLLVRKPGQPGPPGRGAHRADPRGPDEPR
ncbi:MAG TPA: DUF3311 domain-containing protein, partial [Streptosporangiaceae bacterium]|nr:DUF3311 domain-containing protein [Streptosporangiaceae bacterium]